MQRITITVADPAGLLASTAFGAGALYRVERATSMDGTYAEIGTGELDAATTAYVFWDATGLATHWYRTRYSDATGSDFSEYSDPFSPQTAYATLDDLDATYSRSEDDARILVRMQSALVDGIDRITEEVEADFFRHPASGTETRYFEGKGGTTLHVHAGLVTVTSIRIRLDRFTDWIALAATDYDLEARGSPEDPNQATAATYPFDHIVLNGTGATFTTWPIGKRLIEIIGAFGWPRPPRRAVEANVAMARQLMAADRTYPGGVVSPDEQGLPVLPTRLPDAVYRLKAWHSNRFASCST